RDRHRGPAGRDAVYRAGGAAGDVAPATVEGGRTRAHPRCPRPRGGKQDESRRDSGDRPEVASREAEGGGRGGARGGGRKLASGAGRVRGEAAKALGGGFSPVGRNAPVHTSLFRPKNAAGRRSA